MARRDEYESRVEKFLIPIMEENNFELVDVEYVKEAGTWYLRAYIDKEGGFTVDDCEMVSRRLSDWLDKEDFIDDSYILEVSSPGIYSKKSTTSVRTHCWRQLRIHFSQPARTISAKLTM